MSTTPVRWRHPGEVSFPDRPGVWYPVQVLPFERGGSNNRIILPDCQHGEFWRILGWNFVLSVAANVRWTSGAVVGAVGGGTTVVGAQSFLANMGIVVYPANGWIGDCLPGRELTCFTNVPTTVGGSLLYTRVAP